MDTDRESDRENGTQPVLAVTRNARVTRHAAITRDRGVTVTPETHDSERENVTPQNKNKNKNKSIKEPSSISQREIGTNGHRELSHDDLKQWVNTLFGRQTGVVV